jgi:hypothetical protein
LFTASFFPLFSAEFRTSRRGIARTRGKRLLELLGLVLVLEDEGVKVAVAADLELDLLGAGLLDAGSCEFIQKSVFQFLDCES